MMFLLKYWTGVFSILGIFWIALAGGSTGFDLKASESTGPTASDIKAAMVQSGIRAGAVFQIGDKSYTIHNIAVSKTGPENFVVSFVTK